MLLRPKVDALALPEITTLHASRGSLWGGVPRSYQLQPPTPLCPRQVVSVQSSLGWWSARRNGSKETGRVGGGGGTEPPPARPGSGAGLSKRHNFKERGVEIATLRHTPMGSIVQIEGSRVNSERNPKPSKRGKVSEWSAKSRLRLKYRLAGLQRRSLSGSAFMTLTYPGEFPSPTEHATYKRHLRHFYTLMIQRWPSCSGVWKLEFQQRGAAHYHILAFGLSHVPELELRDWILATWFRVVGSGIEAHSKAGTRLDIVRTVVGAMGYMAKYIAKDDQTRPGDFTGRYWGSFNEKNLPTAEQETLELVGSKRVAMVRRWMRRLISKRVNEARRKKAENLIYPRFESLLQLEHVRSIVRNKRRFSILTSGGYIKGNALSAYPSVPGVGGEMRPFRWPQKYRVRNNSSVTLICDSAAFVGAVNRAINADLLPPERYPF